MLDGGLVSITFRQLDPEAIIALMKRTALTHLEWGGDVHCPHGDVDTATRVGESTRDAGLTVSVYGSYYRCGVSEGAGLAFAEVLASARAMQAPAIRVWAGQLNREDADDAYRAKVVDDAKCVADLAAAAGLTIVFEYHGGTLTNTHDGAIELIEAIDRPNVRMGWQPVPERSVEQNLADLDDLLARGVLGSVHAFEWTSEAGKKVRHPLAEGEAHWPPRLAKLRDAGVDVPVLIEFVQGNDPEQFVADAEALARWLDAAR